MHKSLSLKTEILSVAIATYNGEVYIKKQIESILAQTLKPDEIIICDDCSSDKTFEILTEICNIEPTIKLYKNNLQLGVIKNFEKAISLCSGIYIALSDQDDIWEPLKLEKQLSEINKYELKFDKSFPLLCVHDLTTISHDGNLIDLSLWNKLGNNPGVPDNNILFANKYYGCTMLFNKALKEIILPFPDILPMHDHWIALNAFYLGRIITIKNYSLIKYRRHKKNITSIPLKISIIQRLNKYLTNLFGKDFKQKEIMQAIEFYERYSNNILKENVKKLKFIIYMEKYNNIIRKIFFSIKYRFAK